MASPRVRGNPARRELSEIFLYTLKIRDKRLSEKNSRQTSLMASLAIIIAFFSFRFLYQTTLSANWICRDVVDVESIKPAPATEAPDPSNRTSLFVGGLKLA